MKMPSWWIYYLCWSWMVDDIFVDSWRHEVTFYNACCSWWCNGKNTRPPVQVHCALGNAFIIIKPSLNARQDCASWPHKADTIIVKIVSLIDSREKTEAIQCKKTGGATDFRRKLFKFLPLEFFFSKIFAPQVCPNVVLNDTLRSWISISPSSRLAVC